jgi:hypothetical protein
MHLWTFVAFKQIPETIKPFKMYQHKRKSSLYFSCFLPLLLLLMCLFACKKDKDNDKDKNTDDDIVVITATGDINARMDEFRQMLGSQLNTTPNAVGGRREINWDGVPAELLGKKLPPDFFNPVGANAVASRQRGLVYEAAGELMVSSDNFASVNPDAATQVKAFSGSNSFANVSSSLWEVFPQKPGTNIAAKVQGFGVVFSDVDKQNSTFLEFFDGDKSLGKFFAPVHEPGSAFSFLGVYFKNNKVTKIRVGHDGALGEGQKDITNGGTKDLVALDDFLYSEPVVE